MTRAGAPPPLARAALPADTVAMARALLGKLLVRVLDHERVIHASDDAASGDHAPAPLIGRIVETEAYPPGDEANHAYRGLTPRNRAMFGERGHAYVYVIYGAAFMLNVTSEAEGVGAGVLLRALEPLAGIAPMQAARGGAPLADLARGPGRLAAAMRIDRTLDGVDLCAEGPLWLAADGFVPRAIGVSARIGLTRAASRPLRFYVKGSRFVSGPARLNR